jgi:hypothetical protein
LKPVLAGGSDGKKQFISPIKFVASPRDRMKTLNGTERMRIITERPQACFQLSKIDRWLQNRLELRESLLSRAQTPKYAVSIIQTKV